MEYNFFKKHPDIPRYYEFGKLVINKQLLGSSILSIRSNTKTQRPILTQKRISEEFRQILKTLFMSQEINYQLLQDVNKEEQGIYILIMQKSGKKEEMNFDEKK
jgi:hypothetical protein